MIMSYLDLNSKVPYIKNYAENGIVKEIGPTTAPASSPITLSNARNKELVSLNAYGYCSQSGVPTPTSPVPIVSNNGEIKLSPNLINMSSANIVLYKYIHMTEGTIGVSPPYFYNSQYIPVVSGQNYVAYGKNGNTLSYENRIHWYDSTQTFISSQSYVVGTIASGVAPANAVYARFSCKPGSEVTTENILSFEWVFAKGVAEIPYIPYGQIYTVGTTETISLNNTNVATCANLLKVGAYQDIQEIISGNITRNVGVKVLKGDSGEGWYWADAWSGSAYIAIPDIVSSSSVISTHVTTTMVSNNVVFFQRLGDYAITTVTEWTQFLVGQYVAGTPVIIVYPLATPTTKPVSAQQLSTQIGDNTLAVNISGLEISCKYKGGR